MAESTRILDKVNILISVPHSTLGCFQLQIICGKKKDSNLWVLVKKRLQVSAVLHRTRF